MANLPLLLFALLSAFMRAEQVCDGTECSVKVNSLLQSRRQEKASPSTLDGTAQRKGKQRKKCREAFEDFDSDHSGQVDQTEIRVGLENMGKSDEFIHYFLEHMEQNAFNFDEDFMAAAAQVKAGEGKMVLPTPVPTPAPTTTTTAGWTNGWAPYLQDEPKTTTTVQVVVHQGTCETTKCNKKEAKKGWAKTCKSKQCNGCPECATFAQLGVDNDVDDDDEEEEVHD